MPKPKKKQQPKGGTSGRGAEMRRSTFVKHYISNGCNGTQAAVAAGWSLKSAGAMASRMLKDSNIQARIDHLQKRFDEVTGLDAERTLKEIGRVAYFDPGRTYRSDGSSIPTHELDDDTRACVAGEEVIQVPGGETIGFKRKFHDKLKALDMAARHHGLYEKDNNQVNEKLRVEIILVG